VIIDKYNNVLDESGKIVFTSSDVLQMLRPEGGWAIYGNTYEGIEFISCEPVSKEEFESAFATYEAWKISKDQEKDSVKNAALSKLQALGLTEEEAKAITTN
jgi:hypothetical protein